MYRIVTREAETAGRCQSRRQEVDARERRGVQTSLGEGRFCNAQLCYVRIVNT